MDIRVSRVLHAGYIFEAMGTRILFDPLFESPFSFNCYAYPPVEFLENEIKNQLWDAVFISHYHDDHCSLESLKLLNRETKIYLYCVHAELFDWIRALGFQNVESLDLNIPIEVGPFKVTPRRALDADVDSLFQIQCGTFNILNVVDSWIDQRGLESLVSLKPWDLILWPFQLMNELAVLSPVEDNIQKREVPGEWLTQLQALAPRVLVPSSCQFQHESWSWYQNIYFPISYQEFAGAASAVLPNTPVINMNPGTTWVLSSSDFVREGQLSWVRPLSFEEVDYHFDNKKPIPSAAECAKNFPPLSTENRQTVLEYCKQGLIEDYNKLDTSEETFFNKSVIWKLVVLSSSLEPVVFYYHFLEAKIETIVSDGSDRYQWCTEIFDWKLHSALTSGETLSSLYVRIHQESDEAKAVAHLMEDPLLRALYEGKFCQYQWHQLQRILGKAPKI